MIVHGGLIARRVGGWWMGALVEGPSGVGKSDLSLRAVAEGFSLVADDRVLVFRSGGRLYGRSPDVLAGLIEIRGQGVVRHPFQPFARIALNVSCVSAAAEVDRAPEEAATTLLGVLVPTTVLWPFELSAPAKLAALLEHLGARAQERYQAGLAPPGGRLGD